MWQIALYVGSRSSNGTEESGFAVLGRPATWKLARRDMHFCIWMYFGMDRQRMFWNLPKNFDPLHSCSLELFDKKCKRSCLIHPFLNSSVLVALHRGLALSWWWIFCFINAVDHGPFWLRRTVAGSPVFWLGNNVSYSLRSSSLQVSIPFFETLPKAPNQPIYKKFTLVP